MLGHGRSLDEIGVLARSGKLVMDMVYESKEYDSDYENIVTNLYYDF